MRRCLARLRKCIRLPGDRFVAVLAGGERTGGAVDEASGAGIFRHSQPVADPASGPCDVNARSCPRGPPRLRSGTMSRRAVCVIGQPSTPDPADRTRYRGYRALDLSVDRWALSSARITQPLGTRTCPHRPSRREASPRLSGDVTAIRDVSFEVGEGRITSCWVAMVPVRPRRSPSCSAFCCESAGTARILGCDMARDRHRVLPLMNFSSPMLNLPHRLTVRRQLRVYGELYSVDRPNTGSPSLPRNSMSDFSEPGEPIGFRPGKKTRVALAKALI